MEIIFDDYGIEIAEREGKYFIRYDSGEIVSKQDEIEVSKEDAEKAQIDSNSAYQVLIKYQNIRTSGNR